MISDRLQNKSRIATVILFLIYFALPATVSAQLSGFEYRKKLTVDNTQVSGTSDLMDFPVLVNLTDDDLATLGNGGLVNSPNGFDIAFTSGDGSTQLDHELEEYDAATGNLLVWVRFPVLSAASDTDFYIYFGNPSQTTDLSTSSTWDVDYELVLHMDDLADATSNGNNGVNNGTGSTGGQLGNARSFSSAANDFVSVSDDPSLDITVDLTMSAWINVTNINAIPDILTKGDWDESYSSWVRGNGTLRFADDGTTRVTSSGAISNGTPAYVTFTNSTGGSAVYINGALNNTGSTGFFSTNNNPFTISSNAFPLDGWVDEVRVSSVARSADWIATEYSNQNAPGSFYTEDPEPPVLGSVEPSTAAVVAGGAPVIISSSVTISTPFVDSLESATVQISSNYDSAEDELAFSDTGLISGSWNPVSGILTLSGRASVADYQAALRTVTYQNTDASSPSLTTRTISFTASDIFYTSSAVNRDITVTQIYSDLSTDIANTVFHFDAQDIDGDLDTADQPADGTAVSSWGDRSQNAGGSTQTITNSAPSGDEPLFDSFYLGERGGLFFDFNSGDNGDNFQVTSDNLVNLTTYDEKSFAVLFRTGNDLSGLQVIYEQGAGSNGYQISIKDGSLYAYAWSANSGWSTGDESIDLGSVSPNENYIVIANHDAASNTWEAMVNGGAVVQSTGDASTMNAHGGDPTIAEEDGTKDPVTFASNPGTTNNFDGYLGELVSWNTALSAGQMVSIYNYLCDKWCNEAPLLAGIESTALDFTEGNSPTAVTSAISITDADNTLMDSTTVVIAANYQSAEDVLSFTDTGSITGNWDSATGKLTLTGTATIADYQTALRSVTYQNTNVVSPVTAPRTIDFNVYDWDDVSNTESRTVNVIAVNSSPVLSGIAGPALSYTEGSGPVTPPFTVTISDLDDTNMESATISISSNYFIGEDLLGFSDTPSITGSFNTGSGVLILSGSATLAEYETALENITYENTSSDPVLATRTISFTVNDGDNNSNTESRDLDITAVNSPPVLTGLESTTLIFEGSPVNITNTIQVNDPDDTAIDSALVIISSNLQSAQDGLQYSSVFGISGSYNASTGKLLLSGQASFSDYQAALRSVRYNNIATIPTGPPRQISFLAYDDEGAESDTVSRAVAVNAIESVTGLTVWLRADAGVSTSGTEVTAWADQSGNGNDFTGVADAGIRPTFVGSSSFLGGQPAINFAGDGDHFLDIDGEDYINGSTEFTLFLVYKSDLTNTNRGLWNVAVPSGADEFFTIRYDASGANNGNAFTNVVKSGILVNSPFNQLESFSDIQSTGPQIMSLQWESGTTYDIYVDGILNNPSYAAGPPSGTITNAERAIVGKGSKDDPDTPNESWDGQIAEVILYNRSLPEDERQAVEDYLSEKYDTAIRKITAATGGEAISADDANSVYTALTGPIIQEGIPGELTAGGTLELNAPSGYEWNTGSTPGLTISPTYGGTTSLAASFTGATANTVTFTINTASSSTPGQVEFSGLEIRPTTGTLPNTGNITNTGTTGQGGGTNYGTLVMVAGAADSLTFSRQPSTTTVNNSITPAVRVQVVDQFGNEVSASGITVNMTKNSGPGNLGGTTSASTNGLGLASFSSLSLDAEGTYNLSAGVTGLDSEISDPFNVVSAGSLTSFRIERVPSGNISSKFAGQPFDIRITAIDGSGTTVPSFNGKVSVTSSCILDSGIGSTANFTNGVLNSHSVSVTSTGNCTLTATNIAGSETGESNVFTVRAGPADPATSIITAAPTVIQNNGASTSTITVQLRDAYDNNLTTGGNTVAFSATAGTLGPVTDNLDGTYSATLTSSTTTTVSTITGTLGGDDINDDAEVEFAAFSHIWESQTGSASVAADWFDPDNWNVGSVPNASSIILIPANPAVGNEFPVVDVTNTTVSELTLETGAQLTVSNSTNFIVTGSVTGNGDILGSNNDSLTVGGDLDVPEITLGTVIFNGTSDQNMISPHSYVNLEIDNPGTVFTEQNLTVSGTLSLTDGELLIPSGNNLIANDQNYGGGELRFQRRISGVRGWRMVSSPVASTIGDFLDGTLTQGYPGAFYSTGSLPGDTLQPNVLTYLEDYPGTDNQRYRAPTGSGQSLIQGQGMWVFFFGAIAADPLYNAPLPDTLDVSGQEFQGDGTQIDFGVTYTLAADSGWNFIGNPFGASIDWDDASNWTKTNIESTIYIWDPAANAGNGEYLTWNGTTGTLGSGLIAPFQGFWIKANGPSPVLRLNENAKTTGANFTRKTAAPVGVPVIELEARANGLSKRTNFMFSDEGSRNRDRLDGQRLIPFSDTHIEFFSVLDDGTQLSINNLPASFSNRINIPLVLRAFDDGEGISGEFMIRWNGMRAVPEEWLITLIDEQTGERIDLRETQEYIINHSTQGSVQSNSSPVSTRFKMSSSTYEGDARFILQISTAEIETNIPQEFYLEQNYPNPFNPSTTIPFGLSEESPVRLEIYDILGRKIQTLINEARPAGRYDQFFEVGGLSSGVYFYRLETNQGTFINRMTLIK